MRTKSRFIRVVCNDCGNEQIIFDRASTEVKCLVCNKVIAEPGSGKIKLNAEVVGVTDRSI